MSAPVVVVGGGLAGSEAAWQLGSRGIEVVLYEMRPVRTTPAHATDRLAELVCSNTLGSRMPHTAPGIFKRELEKLGSLILAAGRSAYVPAGGALGVDRDVFAAAITETLEALPTVTIRREEITKLPPAGEQRWILATGPLTSETLAAEVQAVTGTEDLYFYDAIAPIVDLDSVDPDAGWWQNRWDAPDAPGGDYYNLPLDKAQYEAFIEALLSGEQVPSKDFEEERFFAGCQPIEAIAGKGRESLRFGPMKPVGLTNPKTGTRAWAVLQLRRETRRGTAMNLVGFQTKLRYGEQTRVLRSLPGLENAEFLRLGSVHRNTFINAPKTLDTGLRLKTRPDLSFAGQVVGCEGYTESSAMGLWAALNVIAERDGRSLPLPPGDSMLGALLGYLTSPRPGRFEPMNVNFGLLPADTMRVKKRDKKNRRIERGVAAVDSLSRWADEHGLGHAGPDLPLAEGMTDPLLPPPPETAAG
jgi:methylenetetrahydrofolate--tRNA-(uracil-5-)-methyltransferase